MSRSTRNLSRPMSGWPEVQSTNPGNGPVVDPGARLWMGDGDMRLDLFMRLSRLATDVLVPMRKALGPNLSSAPEAPDR